MGLLEIDEKEDSMRIFGKFLALSLVLISVATAAWAASKCQPEFDKIKSLAGNWEGKSADGKPLHINYRLVSGGTAVMESISSSSDNEMVTLYYLDGDHVMMTHYCMADNQPRMRADATTSNQSAIKFSFVDVTNLSRPDAGHMYAHSIEWKDSNHVTQHWTWREGKQEKVETFELQRKN
jgi:hypothetical protein